MPSILKKTLKLMFVNDPTASLRRISRKDRQHSSVTERELIGLESQIGKDVFGPLPANVVRREFFNLDEKTWLWHEEVRLADGTTEELTTRYEIQSRGILKIQPGPRYTYLDGMELYNFSLATKEYYQRVTRQLYRRDPATGKPF